MLLTGRTVLSMMDEALYVYKKTSRAIQLVATVPWDAEGFETQVSDAITKKCGRGAVVIVNDMVEQHYRKERVLTSGVSILDRKTMVQRKLNMAFSNYPVRAALPLKEKIKGEGGKMTSDVFIFAAVPNTQQLSKTIAAVNVSLAATKGLVLLPVEATGLVNTLAKKLRKKNDSASKWVVMIGQHRNGGLRQIVTKDGEIALTRMSPIVDSDDNPSQWADEVVQEFRATMSYLTRFGFQPEDGLDIIVLSTPEAGELVSKAMDERFNAQSLTPSNAAKIAGISIGPQDSERYTDPLHLAWIGKSARYSLPMRSKMLETVSKPRQIANIAASILIIGVLFLSWQLLATASSTAQIAEKVKNQRNHYNRLNAEYQAELAKKQALGFDVRLIQSSMTIFAEYQKTNIKPLKLIKAIGEALGSDMRIDSIEIQSNHKDEPANPRAPGFPGTQKPLFEAGFQITYPGDADIIKGNQEVTDLAARLRSILPGNTIEVTKLLKDYKYVEEITVETGAIADDNIEQDFIAEITIKGPLMQ